MIPREMVKELVESHRKLDDPMTAAIWIRRDAPEAWLVEVVPSMAADDRAGDPIFFSPGVEFRFPVAIIAASKETLSAALRQRPDLARDIASGEVLFEGGDAGDIVETARALAAA